jgi:hypothetical protein
MRPWASALFALLSLPAEAAWVVRDATTGAPLPATVAFFAGAVPEGLAGEDLAARLAGAPDRVFVLPGGRSDPGLREGGLLRVAAEGYRPLVARFEPGARGITFWVEPEGDPPAPRPAPGELLLEGHVWSGKDLLPLKGVPLRVEPLGWETVSDDTGAFRLAGLLPPPAGEPAFLTLLLKPPGATAFRPVERALPWAPGWARRIVHDDELALRPTHRHFALAEEIAAQRPPGELGERAPAAPEDPPQSIRVGFNDANCTQVCCGSSCPHVCVFPLETYVRRGITHEWIASWHQHALRAGTVAYRGYGAWRVSSPIAAAYDICSSACCQVNGGTIHSNGIAAVARTRGILMLRNGQRFSAEYSAENNCLLGSSSCSNTDLSCGNGFNGSPANDWPCLADPVGLDRACFGHGRGMSQWGSQRWAIHASTPRAWPWIVNHYYNANGAGSGRRTAVMSRVLAIEGVELQPAALHPGQSLAIRVQARNRAAEPHERVLIGASIRRGTGPWISDPANDAAVVLPSGAAQPERLFRVPPGAAPGSYEVAVSLFLDIDEDLAIASGDLLQASLTLSGALTVLALPEGIFADGFE